jgi:multiple sugar transport system ATP-binding protein
VAEVTLEDVSKVYGEDVVAVRDLSLDIEDGEFVVFVGPSGCGKSTALRMIAGLEDVTRGKVFIGDNLVNELPPRDRDVAMVFQNYALYPHMNVRENMGFALKLKKISKDEIDRRVEEAARILSVERFLDRKPKALSGGQRQRVALGRAIVREPNAFLMDEPLSNLDAKLRVQMRTEIGKLHDRIGTTTIYVTHDQTEAMTMADRIVLLKDGVVQQVATPQEMYDNPRNVFVAGFVGSPAMNFVRARLEKENGGLAVVFGDVRVSLPKEIIRRARDVERFIGREVILGIRPEDLEDAGMDGNVRGATTLEVEPQMIESMGSAKYVYFALERVLAARMSRIDMDEWTGRDDETSKELLVAQVSPASGVRLGHMVRLVVDSSKVHLFDPETEETILRGEAPAGSGQGSRPRVGLEDRNGDRG